MAILNKLEQNIFYVDGIRVALSGSAPLISEYWKTKFKADGTVAEFKARFSKRYPGIGIVLFNGVGLPAHGNYLLKNLRATYEFAWIKNEHADIIEFFHELFRDQEKKIKALRKALRRLSQSAAVEKEAFDPYEALNVKPDSSDEEIKQAYKKRIHVFHPDRFATMDQLVIEFANEKAQQINRARDEIARQRVSATQA